MGGHIYSYSVYYTYINTYKVIYRASWIMFQEFQALYDTEWSQILFFLFKLLLIH